MIDTKSMRAKILDLAMRGQLTEQLPEDGTAEELFQQIQAEKQKLIQAGIIKKEKPLPEIDKDEKPFAIPDNWIWVRLGALLRVINGVSYDKIDIGSEGIRILRAGNIVDTRIVLNDNDVFLPSTYRDDDKIVQNGDMIIVASTGSETAIGRAGFVVQEYTDVMIGAFLRICRPFLYDTASFLRAIFCSDYYRQHIRQESKGTNINNVKEKYITQFLVPLPPLAEQQRIVEKIQQIFLRLDIIDDLQKQYSDNLTVLKSKLIDAAIQGKLTEQLPEDGTAEELYQQIQEEKRELIKVGKIKKEKPMPEIKKDEIPFNIPANWKWCRLAEIASTNIGLTYHPEDIVEDGTIVVRSSNIINSRMDYTDLVKVKCPIRENQYLNKNDIVICARNGSKALVGKCAVYEGESGVVSFGAFMAVLRTPFYKYVFYYLLTDAFRRYFRSDDSKQINQVTQSILKEAIIPLPPLAEQVRIVEKLDEVLTLVGA